MDLGTLVGQLLNNPASLQSIIAPLPDKELEAVVDRLKQEADRHWWINANRSLEIADIIIRIGQLRGNLCHTALGTMARGDALKLLGRTEEAWQTLDQAGALFQECGDEVGWARTRIGRLLICVDLNRVAEALADAERARDIFTCHVVHEKRLVLDLNTAIVYKMLGDQEQALRLYRSALTTAEALGEVGQRWIGPLFTNIGNVYYLLGDFRQAWAYHERAHALFAERNETSAFATAELNLARVAMAQGHYPRALNLLHRAHDLMVAEKMPLEAAHVKRHMVECYLLLNRYAEARDLAQQVSAEFRAFGAAYEEAITLLHLASAEAELSDFDGALASLDAAEPIFAALGAAAWVATTQLRRGRIALRRGDIATAQHEAIAAAACFESGGQQVDYAAASLLHGQALLAANEPAAAAQTAATALCIARRGNVPALRYAAHLLLGRVAESQGHLIHAARRYAAAAATVERVQRRLTITLRPGFLEDKGEALQALLAIQLRSSSAARAFETLERAKSQVLLNYLANREQLRWAQEDPRSRALIEELNQLREEHQWFYGLAHEHEASEEGRLGALDPRQALSEVTARERRMRAITEQLYLRGAESDAAGQVSAPSLEEIQRSLDQDTLLIEFYNDGAHLWAFTLDTHTLEVHRLPATAGDLDRLLIQLQANLAFGLKAGPAGPVARNLTIVAQRILQRLYTALLGPLVHRIGGRRRLAIVPYGALHYLPFHLLHNGSEYLIEQCEVVVLPAAGLATRRGPTRPRGALALAHSWNGHLPQTLAEAQIVGRLFGGNICRDQAAGRAALRARPTQILHIAAHGEYRLDQPELSYIQLADGQLYADDLMQQDLSYELVTLSACETGRANVAGGDELIGLGRGVLYAGAGALITSLWRVADDSAVALMEHMYNGLCAGASKAAALRDAQCAILHQGEQPHPAFWGAFQLIGDAGPLSMDSPPGLKGA
ncbi:MAG TPA: CHAT domain-containing tetratricopeptide repeat protein [Roseiflexaceae bacterium]